MSTVSNHQEGLIVVVVIVVVFIAKVVGAYSKVVPLFAAAPLFCFLFDSWKMSLTLVRMCSLFSKMPMKYKIGEKVEGTEK